MNRLIELVGVGIVALSVGLGCEGEPGEAGPQGPPGAAGADGTDGADGQDGAEGAASLLELTAEPAGENCAAGGVKVEHGLDLDGDGVLDPEEIQGTGFLCDGADGADGTNGQDGADGADGASSLIATTAEPAGENCADGGVKIEHGLDADGDGVLDAEEVEGVQFVCDGADGSDGASSLIKMTAEPAGENCADGGLKIEHGLDADGDGVLDAEEVAGEGFVCNGADGADGASSLLRVSPEPAGDNCADGGVAIEHGLDADGDGILDPEEVQGTQFVCDGADGADAAETLFAVTDLPVGDADCPDGGVLVEFGGDTSGDGVLDAGEIDNSFRLCNGADGADGTDGQTSLIEVFDEPAGDNCQSGGIRIHFGLDADGSGTLEAGEFDAAFVCDGADAPTT